VRASRPTLSLSDLADGARSAIGQFHAHEKRIAQAKTPIARCKLERDQDTLADYQSASLTGASSGGETSKWLVQQLPAVLVDEATGVRRSTCSSLRAVLT
jgi:hypothetical protein